MNIFACTNCNSLSNPCDHTPCFLSAYLSRHYWIFIPICLYTRKAESADPMRTLLRFSESAFFPPEVYVPFWLELPWLRLRIIVKYLVFWNKRNCIQRRHVTTWLSLLADRVMFLLQITSLCLHTESSICHRSEAIWNSSALMTPFFPQKEGTVCWTNHCWINYLRLFCRR